MTRSIATKSGDDGTTSLLFGQRVPKNHAQIEAVGAYDELNAALGTVKTRLGRGAHARELRTEVEAIQRHLVALMGELACAEADSSRHEKSKFVRLGTDALQRLDTGVAALEARGLKLDGWATPGATALAAALDVARTAARRAERHLVALPAQGRTVRPLLFQFTNRLSDYLWLLAREAEQ